MMDDDMISMPIGQDFTRRLLEDAGLTAGMRVLDLGCGGGDVSILAARLVGETGQVHGIDIEAGPLNRARERIKELGLSNITFSHLPIEEIQQDDEPFDAVIGRRVLLYLPDPAAAIARVSQLLRPGGLIALHEHSATMTPASLADLPLHDRVLGWVRAMIDHEGADPAMGLRLYGLLSGAGFDVADVRAEAVLQTPTRGYPLAGLVQAVLPRILASGAVTEAEIGLETLAARLADERRQSNATYVADMMFGAWGHKAREAA
ncbi:MAG: methyltransferase domain-containing protein [Pseudomonadota bacterium]